MATYRAPYLYTETRLNLDQGYTNSTVEITLPNGDSQPAARRVLDDAQAGSDEATFARRHVATDGSVYFRREHRYPRSFLWRLLDDRRVLEIQSVDLEQDDKEKENAMLTLLLRFPAAIRPFCVAFGDPDERDVLEVYAITTDNRLWTLVLHKDFFVNLKATELLTMEWCQSANPSSISSSDNVPYRLFATSSRMLFASLSSGGLARIFRTGQDGLHWKDRQYTEDHWAISNVTKSLTFWSKRLTTRAGDLILDHTAALAVALSSPDDSKESKHILTVCMNHVLRIWNLESGRIVAEQDLLGEQDQEQRKQARYLMGPTQRQLLQVFDMPGKQEYFVVTYSPGKHQFKFWAVMDDDAGDSSPVSLHEMRPHVDFTPPIDELMDTSVWSLEEFYLRPSRGTKQTQLWVRVRSGPTSQVFTVEFDPFDFGHRNHEVDVSKIQTAWKESWVSVSTGRQTVEALDAFIPVEPAAEGSPVQIPSEDDQWLDFLLYPGRFTVATLETALHIFNKAIKRTVSGATLKMPLKGRLFSAIAASERSAQMAESHNPVQEPGMDSQWHVFYILVRDLHKRRCESLSFAVDPVDQLPWLVSADAASPIRKCNDLELAEFNRSLADKVPDLDQILSNPENDDSSQIGVLLGLARSFRGSFSPAFQDTFKRAVLLELLEEPIKNASDRLHDLQRSCALREQYAEEDFESFQDAVEAVGGYPVFASENFDAIINSLKEKIAGRETNDNITRFGANQLIRVAQESIAMNTEALLDLLSILLFIEDEFEPADLEAAVVGDDDPNAMDESDDLVKSFNASSIFTDLTRALRDHEVLRFLTTNIRQEGRKKRQRSGSNVDGQLVRMSGTEPVVESTYSCTLLESMFIGDWTELKCPEDLDLPSMITYRCRAWFTQMDVSNFENFTAHVLADLIKNKNYALAAEFLPYVPLSQWSGYLRGRLALATGEHTEAVSWFKKSAYSLCKFHTLVYL